MARRPPLHRLVLYAVGFRLPERYDEWVFHDLTDRGWRLREVGRIVCLALPFIVGALLLPGGTGLRLMTASILVVGPAFIGAAYSDEFRAYRLRQHGLLPPQEAEPDIDQD